MVIYEAVPGELQLPFSDSLGRKAKGISLRLLTAVFYWLT
ncbi:hypothetical protein Slin_4471 [Spirosoma linguale DSM 74]|uniref:Uncharacterized protein n=1 Tax=Spirosoma linguale (strain ATCC 33905 / DSM 74 / LMG 10896 / Claus 1) TaxID=504472 RepID=D2QMN8_SPILD|nr:hypothetical protein Slin_4471 [Spirosoma linguale DSM 74]